MDQGNDSPEPRRTTKHRFITTHYSPITVLAKFEDSEDQLLPSKGQSPFSPRQQERAMTTLCIPATSQPEPPLPPTQTRGRFTSLLSRLCCDSQQQSDSASCPKPTQGVKQRARKSSSSDNTGTSSNVTRKGVDSEKSRNRANQVIGSGTAYEMAFVRSSDEQRRIRHSENAARNIENERSKNQKAFHGYSKVIVDEMARKSNHGENVRTGRENEKIRNKIDRNRGIPVERYHQSEKHRMERQKSLTAEEIFWGPKGATSYGGKTFGAYTGGIP